MVGHETVGKESDSICVIIYGERGWAYLSGVSRKVGIGQVYVEVAEESFVVSIILENYPLFYTAIVDMIVRTRFVFFDTMF